MNKSTDLNRLTELRKNVIEDLDNKDKFILELINKLPEELTKSCLKSWDNAKEKCRKN